MKTKSLKVSASQNRRRPRSRFADEYGVLLNELIAARQKSGVTQTQVAHRLGKTQSHVSMCENREREISILDLKIWCEAIGMSCSEFIALWEKKLTQSPNKET